MRWIRRRFPRSRPFSVAARSGSLIAVSKAFKVGLHGGAGVGEAEKACLIVPFTLELGVECGFARLAQQSLHHPDRNRWKLSELCRAGERRVEQLVGLDDRFNQPDFE